VTREVVGDSTLLFVRRFNSGETEITWYVVRKIPIIVFINKMDREGKTLLKQWTKSNKKWD
jgi:hypothetical protein